MNDNWYIQFEKDKLLNGGKQYFWIVYYLVNGNCVHIVYRGDDWLHVLRIYEYYSEFHPFTELFVSRMCLSYEVESLDALV